MSPRVGTFGSPSSSGAAGRRARDPGRLSPEERLAELGAILAEGYRRLRLRQKPLDESAEPEAASDAAVNGNGAEEVA